MHKYLVSFYTHVVLYNYPCDRYRIIFKTRASRTSVKHLRDRDAVHWFYNHTEGWLVSTFLTRHVFRSEIIGLRSARKVQRI